MLLGGPGTCDETRFGGTQYAKEIERQLWGLPPALDLEHEKRVQEAIREIVAEGLAESAHDLSDGGLAVALAECCFGTNEIGAQVDLDSDLRPELLCFHEGPVAHSGLDGARQTSGGDCREARRGCAGHRQYH